jgi:hypothetical protein
MNEPTRWQVGDKVKITPESLQNIKNSSRSINAFPDSDYYIAKGLSLMTNNVSGTVTMTFPPGFEVNVTFKDIDQTTLQMKDHWIEKA